MESQLVRARARARARPLPADYDGRTPLYTPSPSPSRSGCSVYAFCCLPCAAADVSEAIHPGTCCSYFCCLALQSFLGPVGYFLNVCKILGTRKALAQRDNIPDDVDCLSLCCCMSCYVGQELAHIEATRNGANK